MLNLGNVRRIAIGSVAGLTLAAGLAWGAGFPVATVNAQADGTVQEQGNFLMIRDGRGGRGFGQRSFGQRGPSVSHESLLANSLGVTPVALQEAQAAAKDAVIDQAAAAGAITAEQAAQIKEGQRPDGDISGLRTYAADVDRDAALAEALGMTAEALTAAKDAMVQRGVEAGLITQEQGNQMLLRQKIQEATRAAMEQAIDEAVAEGLITQEEADAMKDGSGGRGHGGDHSFGRRGGNRGGERGGRGFGSFGRGFFGGEGQNSSFEAPAPSNTALSNL